MSSNSENSADMTQIKLRSIQNDYIELLQSFLTGSIYRDTSWTPYQSSEFDAHVREHGLDWPAHALTMVGVKRLANLRKLTESVIIDKIPGDLIETGVWRGGACILMRAILEAHNIQDRVVWVADSFAGLPVGNALEYPADADCRFHTYEQLAVSIEEVQANFREYGFLDERTVFLKGWFKDTLPDAPIERLALMRLDGDMYESTMDALSSLYPRLSYNGYVIIDDYHVVAACKAAVHDYCDKFGITPQINEIDGVGVYWRKTESSRPLPAPAPGGQNLGTPELHLSRLHWLMIELSQKVISRLHQSLEERDAEIAQLISSQAGLNANIAQLNKTIKERDAEIGTLRPLPQSLSDLEKELGILIKTVEEQRRELAKIYASTSWKITKPLRGIRNLLLPGK
jgi:hypothetical protein